MVISFTYTSFNVSNNIRQNTTQTPNAPTFGYFNTTYTHLMTPPLGINKRYSMYLIYTYTPIKTHPLGIKKRYGKYLNNT